MSANWPFTQSDMKSMKPMYMNDKNQREFGVNCKHAMFFRCRHCLVFASFILIKLGARV